MTDVAAAALAGSVLSALIAMGLLTARCHRAPGRLSAAGAAPAGPRRRLVVGPVSSSVWSWPRARHLRVATGVATTLLAALVATAGSPGWAGPVGVPLALTAGLVVGAAAWLAGRAAERAAAGRTRADVVEACEALAAGLRAGLPPERVLARTAQDVPLLVPAATAARLGADVAAALRTASTRSGAQRLVMLAAAWDVARRSGAGLAEVVSRIAVTVRADAGRRRQVDAALGGARSTARLFAVLPVLGIALGSGMDADPVGVLTGTPAGAWTLCAGVFLAVTGLVWVERLADGATR